MPIKDYMLYNSKKLVNSLIILAAGNGLRANQKHPKQFVLLDEKDFNSRLLYKLHNTLWGNV